MYLSLIHIFHRRILYAFNELGLTHDKPYRKSAAVVGEVMAKYHPHGNSATYGTIVRLAQDFNSRYPMVDGQGNFGSVSYTHLDVYRRQHV